MPEPVGIKPLQFAFIGRTSTEDNQDPTLSLPRQLANCERAVESVGGLIVAYYYDVESGNASLASRGSGRGLKGLEIPIPREGGLLDLLDDARDGKFDAVICESISRFSRNPSVTFRAEEDLRDAGVKLWAADEPWEESFGSIVLRHVNVGIARGYLHELKAKSWQGVETAARQGATREVSRCTAISSGRSFTRIPIGRRRGSKRGFSCPTRGAGLWSR